VLILIEIAALVVPLPLLAGEVGKRSETGEGGARVSTLTRVASRLDLRSALRGPSSRKAGGVRSGGRWSENPNARLQRRQKLPASFSVRDIELKDRPRWEPLWHDYQTVRKIPEEVMDMTWRRFFDGLEPVYALVAEEGEDVIGFVHYLFHRSTAKLGPVCYLQDMFTVETARRRGVGRALIDAVCVRAKAVGASRVYWNTGEANIAARVLYDKVATLTRFVQYRKEL
jgi:GNAT superfamily N-acetyltransferase